MHFVRADTLPAAATWVGVACMKPSQPGGEVASIRQKIGDFLLYTNEVRIVIGPLPLLLQPRRDFRQPPAIRFRTFTENAPQLRVGSLTGQGSEIIVPRPLQGQMINVVIGAADGAPKRPFIGSFAQLLSQFEVF